MWACLGELVTLTLPATCSAGSLRLAGLLVPTPCSVLPTVSMLSVSFLRPPGSFHCLAAPALDLGKGRFHPGSCASRDPTLTLFQLSPSVSYKKSMELSAPSLPSFNPQSESLTSWILLCKWPSPFVGPIWASFLSLSSWVALGQGQHSWQLNRQTEVARPIHSRTLSVQDGAGNGKGVASHGLGAEPQRHWNFKLKSSLPDCYEGLFVKVGNGTSFI